MIKKYHVRLNKEERRDIASMLDDAKTPKTLRRRCNILLLADSDAGEPMPQDEIARRCLVSDVCVYQTVKDYSTQGLRHVLRRRTHEKPPRKPAVSGGEEAARIIALACGAPPEGFSRWTVRLLAERIVELEIVPAICPETVRAFLKRQSLSLT
jgi:transposase